MFEKLYALFGKVTKEGFRGFMFKRLPFYLLGVFILTIWGVKGFMITTFLVLSFILGWFVKGAINAIKDYRMSQRLTRIHFTQVEYETLKRERDMALKAFEQVTSEKAGRVKAAATPPMPSQPNRLDMDQIREMIRQEAMNGESI